MPTSRPAPPISDEFHRLGAAMSARLGISWVQLLLTMNSEGGVNPGAYNPAGAAGLIQFTNLKGLGWTGTVDEFLDLSPEEQLPFVEKYLAPYRGRLQTHYQIHQALFLPATLSQGSDLDLVLCAMGGPFEFAYTGNRLLDREGKGYITVRDLQRFDLQASKTGRFQGILEQVKRVLPDYAAEAQRFRDASVPPLQPAARDLGDVDEPVTSKAGKTLLLTLVLFGAGWAAWRMYQGEPVLPPALARKLPLLKA